MIKARIAFPDLACAPTWRNNAIHMGTSHIVPYRHNALETLLVRTDHQWFAVVRERHATHSGDGATSDLKVDAERFDQLYREALLWPLDYLLIEVAQHGCRLKLHAGLFGTAPVYCRTTADDMAISYDFADFIARPTTIDPQIASRRLALHADYSARQICSDILMLTERAVLYAEPGSAHYRYPAPIDPPSPSTHGHEDHGLAAFEDLLAQATSARPARARQIAVELSGGMDSATVASALHAAYGPVVSLGILLDDASGSDQTERRRQIVERLSLEDDALDIAAFAPSLDLQPDPLRREYPLPEFYLEAFEGLWDKAQAQNRELLFTGIGGDQLFPVYRNEQKLAGDRDDSIAAMGKRRAERLLTPRARSAAQSLNGLDAPAGPLQPSVLASNMCQAPHLLRRGLWPVSPLSDPRLSAYCCRLPIEHRRDRETMWQYLRLHLGERVFARNYTKETFANVLPKLIAQQAETLASQLRECALADLGLVDRAAVLALLDELIATRARHLTAPLIAFLWLERFVRQVA